jgi:diguanylate cyclase (GGDEF)-like protein/PAS domain S-box-containing protein
LHKKALITICLAALALTAGTYLVARIVLTRSFQEMEDDATRQAVERVRAALEDELQQLESSAVRGGEWDDTYRAMTGADPRQAGARFTREVLDSIGVQVVWIVDDARRTVVAATTAGATPGQLRTLSPSELSRLERYGSQLFSGSGQRPLDRLLRMPQGALAVAVSPILRTDHSGPRAGTLLVGRYLDKDATARAARTVRLPLAITVIGEGDDDALRLPESVRRWLASSPQAPQPRLELRDASMLNGYLLLRDAAGEPLAVLSTGLRRDSLELGRETTTAVIVVVVVGFGCIVLVLLLLINRSWRARTLTELRYRSVGRQLEEILLIADSESGEIVEANPAAEHALGYGVGELPGRNLSELARGLSSERLTRLRTHVTGARRVLIMQGKDGRRFPAEVTVSWIRLEPQVLLCIIARDITVRRRLEKQHRAHRRRLARLALRDSLTGLPNRLYLSTRLPKLIADAARESSLLALLYIDLDHFKDVNESLGHTSGDRLLVTVAERLRSAVPDGDLIVRMSGDEFVVISSGLPAVSAVDYIARRIEETLSAPLEIDGTRLGIVASIGISLCPGDGSNLEQLLKHADIALHQAKARGRGNHQFFTDEMKARLSDRLELEHALRRAISSDQLYLEYQPSFDLDSRLPVSFEALVRWNHPQLGLVPPGRFVPIAEQGSLVLDLGAWVLRRVCKQLAEWQEQELPLLPVSINVTSKQFEHGRLVDAVAGLTREFDVDANLLHFEITEGAVMHNSEQHLGALHALRNLGSRILIDDFGTGYSSLSYLKHLPIDTLKIDRAFVRDMATDSNDAAIVSAIIGLAASLGLHVVAEGVETAEHVDCLKRLGCRTAQGFYFSRPLPAAECRTVLERIGSRRRSGDTAKLTVLKKPTGTR